MDKKLIKEVVKEMILEGDIYIDSEVEDGYGWSRTYLVLCVDGENQDMFYGYELQGK